MEAHCQIQVESVLLREASHFSLYTEQLKSTRAAKHHKEKWNVTDHADHTAPIKDLFAFTKVVFAVSNGYEH